MLNRRLGYIFFFFLLVSACSIVRAQQTDKVFKSSVATCRLYSYGNQQGIPMYALNSEDRIQLEFDDLEGRVKSYFYTLVLCDYNWNPANLSPFDYLKGFTQIRISNYRYSSVALTRYTHYQAVLPDRDCQPTRSGNYILKVFLDGDTSKLVFTKRMLVLDPKAAINAQVVQPFTPEKFKTSQKLRFNANIKNLNSFSAAQQVKVVILQNNRWDIAQKDIPPTFVRGNMLEYNSENFAIFPGGKEWRWADLRGFRLQSDRVERAFYGSTYTDIFMKTDFDRSTLPYIFFNDLNGLYHITTYESINPQTQGDYAKVHFYFRTADGLPLPGRDIYLQGQFTDYQLADQWKMSYDDRLGIYSCTAFLKQGYYNYAYVAVPPGRPEDRLDLEGDYWETENSYTILVYYKGFTDRCDQLIGSATINSSNNRQGFGF